MSVDEQAFKNGMQEMEKTKANLNNELADLRHELSKVRLSLDEAYRQLDKFKDTNLHVENLKMLKANDQLEFYEYLEDKFLMSYSRRTIEKAQEDGWVGLMVKENIPLTGKYHFLELMYQLETSFAWDSETGMRMGRKDILILTLSCFILLTHRISFGIKTLGQRK
jgi:hypothetical protein